jgi:glycogen operon protein
VNFALYSEHAERVELVLFDDAGDEAPSATLALPERTGPVWHGHVEGLADGQLYGYRVHGPYSPEEGHRFNPNKVLLDPYARALGRPLRWDDALFGYTVGHEDADLSFDERDSAPFAPLGAVVEGSFDWGRRRAPHVPWEDTVIYEAHVRGLTMRHPDVPEALRGTYLGVSSEPVLDHFEKLGVTTVQLLPVHAKLHDRHLLERGLRNYWGYNTLSFFAPEPEYATAVGARSVEEFKAMVHALHGAGLEVVVDVVYNHTCEGNRLGPTLSWRGLDHVAYYKESPENPRYHMDYTGTGNTLDAGNPHVLQMITDSLRYWVTEMRVDGFRFDLAATLARDLFEVNMLSAFFQLIQQDPVLSQVKLIAEPWDVGPGGYQVGEFPWQWAEWNGRYRDTVRQFWTGDAAVKGDFATRVTGSADLYERSGRRPFASVNFVTAHDGFTLEDLVSYEQKHNEANGEDNNDGESHNRSTNGGIEGPTDDEGVLAVREARKRGLTATLLLSQGIPMLLGGDELSKTQGGNNNAYCQDNELSWYDWDLDGRKGAFLDFVCQAVAFRRAHPSFHRKHFPRGAPNARGERGVVWWHPEGREMAEGDWADAALHALGLLLPGDGLDGLDAEGGPLADDTFLVLFNDGEAPVSFVLPEVQGGDGWTAPEPFAGAVALSEGAVEVAPRSVGVLARPLPGEGEAA